MSQVAARAFDLLEQIASSPEPLRLMDLVERTGIDKSTASRLLEFLESRSLIRRDPRTKRYLVGHGLLSLSSVALRSSDLAEFATPHLAALRDETGETVAFHLRAGNRRICVAGAESRHGIRRVLALGEQLPLCVGPSGKVMLAFLSEAEIESVIAEGGCEDPVKLHRELAEIRERGYIAVIGGRTPGLGAICFPIFGAGGVPIASMSVAGPESRWGLEAMAAAEPRVRAVAEELSAAATSGVAS
ncbi:MAG TPA: IclR family transcriptional regulator [Capillimicrobium sp.]|nr:IclR family transcriptional regulator [Capillimicrobium sp.]